MDLDRGEQRVKLVHSDLLEPQVCEGLQGSLEDLVRQEQEEVQEKWVQLD